MALDDNILRERISEMQPEENVMTYGKSSTVLAPRRRGAGQLPSLFAAGWTRYSNGVHREHKDLPLSSGSDYE